ncbi:hypothetical protein [Sandaracinus amylolyticus]|uniref:hypothetical protein n=1 Tax=Sandaracinus amylolyticus TaxID=927083 RepID=UPI001F367BF1|nr:hypothetical protein [Sandaracinus amylolyticus]
MSGAAMQGAVIDRARSIDDVACEAAWGVDATCALSGTVRGLLVRRWAENLRRRFGADAADRVKARMGALALADDPRDDAWVPVAAQLRATELVVELFLGGDRRALVPVVIDDAMRNASTMSKLALRTAGPGALLSRTGSLHGHACSEGRAEASVQGSRARLRYVESPLFEHPTWRLLAMTGACGLVALSSRTLVSIEAHDVGPHGFGLEIAWR